MCEEIYNNVVHGLDELIKRNLRALESENVNPGSCPDQMDDDLAYYKSQVEKYRELRTNFENTFSKLSKGGY